MLDPSRHIAVLGAGTIGASWASLFMAHGLDVAVWDPNDHASDGFAAVTARQVDVVRRALDLDMPAGEWVIASTPAEAVTDAQFVQESGPENLQIKHDLFGQIDAALAEDAIVASSTSSIMPTLLQDGIPFANRLLVAHPFNPPHLIPLVEIVAGKLTDEHFVERAFAFYSLLGKHPIRLRTERLGHLANRIQAAVWREAVNAVASGSASVSDVDAAVTQALGLRWAIMGPHMTFHVAGGQGGIAHFINHLGPAFVAQWNDLEQSDLTSDVRNALVAGINSMSMNKAASELAAERDERLLAILAAAKTISGKRRGGEPPDHSRQATLQG